jgi:hypothetical protein
MYGLHFRVFIQNLSFIWYCTSHRKRALKVKDLPLFERYACNDKAGVSHGSKSVCTISQQTHYSDSLLVTFYSSYMFRRMYVIIRESSFSSHTSSTRPSMYTAIRTKHKYQYDNVISVIARLLCCLYFKVLLTTTGECKDSLTYNTNCTHL